jgi:hypothetical protein
MRGVLCRIPACVAGAAGAIAMALVLSGCGGGGGAAGVTPVTASSAQPVAAFAAAQQRVMAAQVGTPMAAAAGSTSLLTNGSFESGMTGWTDWGNTSVVAADASAGTSALRVGTAAGGAGQTVGNITPGTTYRLTAKAKVGAASETVYVGVNFVDSSGQPVKQNAQPISSASYTTATLEVVAPPGAVWAVVYVWKNAGNAYGYVDEFDFEVASGAQPGPASSDNLVINGDFENGFASWDNWGNAGTTSTQAASGTAAAQVGTGDGGFGQRIANVVPGSSYRVSAKTKVSSPDEVAYLGVMFTDAAGNALAVQSAVFHSTTYALAQADLTAPAGAASAVVFVWKNAGSGFAYVDDVSLIQLASDPNAPGVEVAVSSPQGAPVFPLPWGGEVSGQGTSGTSNVLRRYGVDGQQIGAATTVTCGGNSCTATVLRDGGYAATWLVSVGDPTAVSYRIYTQAYTAAAQPIGTPVAVALSRVADELGNPAAVPQLAPLAGGGYVLVWALQQTTQGGANDRGVYTQRFDANGQAAGPAQQATADGAGFLDVIGTTTGGYVVSWGKSAGAVGGARAYGPDGAPLAAEQVAGLSWHTGAGPRGAMAPLAGGGAVVVGQVQGGPVVVQNIDASGAARPAQVASSLGSPDRALVAVGGLPDGGSVVAWLELGGNVYARRFAADGTPVGGQTRINQVTTPTAGTEIMVLADGSFAIAWDVGSTRYARTFPANGLAAP